MWWGRRCGGGRIRTRGAGAWRERSTARHGHVVRATIHRNDAARNGPELHIEEARGGGALFQGALGNFAGESGERAEQDNGAGRGGRAQFLIDETREKVDGAGGVLQDVDIDCGKFKRIDGPGDLTERIDGEAVAAEHFPLCFETEDHQADGSGGDAADDGGERGEQGVAVGRAPPGAVGGQRGRGGAEGGRGGGEQDGERGGAGGAIPIGGADAGEAADGEGREGKLNGALVAGE